MSDALREVNVNGVRFFRADDVERWHRSSVAKAEEWDELSELVERYRETLQDVQGLALNGLPGCESGTERLDAIDARITEALRAS